MDNHTRSLVAAAVVGGYVLGRTKKGRIALTAVTILAARRMGLDPRTVVAEGVRRIGEVPQVAELQAQIRDESVAAARSALTAIADRGLHSIADAIGSRTAGLGVVGDGDGADGRERRESAEDQEGDDQSPQRRRSSSAADRSASAERRSARRKAAGAASQAQEKAGSDEAASSSRRTTRTSPRTDRRR